MKHLTSLLILFSLCATGYAQDKALVLKQQFGAYDCTRSPDAGERVAMNNSAVKATNTSRMQALFDRMHMSTGGIRYPLVLPYGRFYHEGNLHLGINAAESAARYGGCYMGQPGLGFFLNNNHTSVSLGQETRLVDDANEEDTSGASLVYGGSGFTIGNFSCYAFDIPNNDAWLDRDSHVKRDYGLWIKSCNVGSVPTSHLFCAPMQFMGYETAVYITPKTGTSSYGHNTYFAYLGADSCGTVFHVNDGQAVTHVIESLDLMTAGTRGIYLERGGHVHVRGGTSLDPNQVLCEFGNNYHQNYGDCVIDNWKFDNAGTNITVLKLGTYNSGAPRSFRLTGSIGAGVTFHGSGACQGIVEGVDKVYINVTGDPTLSATLNAFSTVDAEGNYLE